MCKEKSVCKDISKVIENVPEKLYAVNDFSVTVKSLNMWIMNEMEMELMVWIAFTAFGFQPLKNA